MARSIVRAPADPVVSDYLDYLRFERGLSLNTLVAYERDLRCFTAVLRWRLPRAI